MSRPVQGERSWYGHTFEMMTGKSVEPSGVVQIGDSVRNAARGGGPRFRLPEGILRLAQDEYDRQHPGQPYERMQERGGLGLTEIISLLADSLNRHGVFPLQEGQ